MSILKTRLYKPPLSKRLVVRNRLIARFNEEIDRPLKLVVARDGSSIIQVRIKCNGVALSGIYE